jgi:hypothetical protein
MVDNTVFAADRSGFWRRRRFAAAPVPARVQRADAETLVNVRSAAVVMLIGFAVFLALDSEGLRHVARDLPGSAASDALVAAADRWHAAMQQVGLARIAPAVREAFETLRDIGW